MTDINLSGCIASINIDAAHVALGPRECTLTCFDRRAALLAEFLGTAGLLGVVVGSGIAAQQLTDDAALQLLINALVTALGLGALILMFAPISGAHFNPVVSGASWWSARRGGQGLTTGALTGYSAAQVLGAVAGTVLANAMFEQPTAWSTHQRSGANLWLAEVVATAGLLLVIGLLARTGRGQLTAVAVGAWIGAAYWWTSSTSFANPAATIGRAFTDSFAGIAPASVPAFIVAQCIGLIVAVALLSVLTRSPQATTIEEFA